MHSGSINLATFINGRERRALELEPFWRIFANVRMFHP